MAKLKLYLDTRKPLQDETFPIKVRVTLKRQGSFLLSTGLSVLEKNWINNKITGNPAVEVIQNNALKFRVNKIETELLQLEINGQLGSMTVSQVKKTLEYIISSTTEQLKEYLVKDHFKHFMSFKTNPSTISWYDQTLKKITAFTNVEALRFEDINLLWLREFEKFLKKDKLSINTISIYLRNIRAISNSAIDEDMIPQNIYPFRKFKIK